MMNKSTTSLLISRLTKTVIIATSILTSVTSVAAQKELSFLFTDDDPAYVSYMEQLSKDFSKEHPDINIKFVTSGYDAILKQLPLQLAVGEGPDIAKVGSFVALSKYALNLRPYLKDPAGYVNLHGNSLKLLVNAQDGKEDDINGYVASQTVNLPFVNVTFFNQAGIKLPEGKYTLDQLIQLSVRVAKEVDAAIPFTMDRSGHRFTGPALSYGSRYLAADGKSLSFPDQGGKNYIADIKSWVDSGAFPKEMWGAAGGSKYKNMGDEFVNGNVVTYFAGNWMINPFRDKIGSDFEWQMLPAPCGDGGCIAQPGGTAIMAFKRTKNPEAVAQFMEFLGNEKNQRYIAEHFLILTGANIEHPNYITDDINVKKSLEIANEAAQSIPDFVRKQQVFTGMDALYTVIIKRVGQMVAGELTLEETYRLLNQDVEQINKELMSSKK